MEEGRILWSRTFANDVAAPLTIRTEDNVLERRLVATPESTLKQIEAVLGPIAYSGPCNIDYKLQGDRMRIFEINPRLGGTLMHDDFRTELKEALACIVERAAVR
jgi:carbamoylphosphate synthase large subunit